MYTVHIHFPRLQIDEETSHDINKQKKFEILTDAIDYIREQTATTPFDHVVLSGRDWSPEDEEEEDDEL